jgi:acetyl/propionyl-CoA carboxylase alpha subunit
VLHKIEEIIFPDPHLLPSEIALQQAGEQTAFQQNIKLRHDLELKDKKIYEQDEERKDLEMKLVLMEERQKALEETVTAARYAQFQAKQQLVTLQLESIEYRKQVDKTSNTINAAVQKKMGFVPWEAQKEIQNLATLTTAQVLKYENLVEADKDVLMIDP